MTPPVDQALLHRLSGACCRPERSGHGVHHVFIGVDRVEPGEPDPIGMFIDPLGCNLQGEPGLPGPSRTMQRHQAVAIQQLGNDGQVTVNVSRQDYVGFREDLDHDQLCQSLADVFLDFLHMHREGQDARIVDRLDAMKIGIFS